MDVDYASFPLLSEYPPVRAISAKQYIQHLNSHSSLAVPTRSLFPYLHSSSSSAFSARYYPANYKTISLISATTSHCNNPSPPSLKNSIDRADVLDQYVPCTFAYDPIPSSSPRSPVFVNPRNFHLQTATIATLSDFIVYSPYNDFDFALETAKQLSSAQVQWRERGIGGGTRASGNDKISYCYTFVLTDSFQVIEREHPSLIEVSSEGRPLRHINFLEREMEEMKTMTTATEILPNLWVGNSWELGDYLKAGRNPCDSCCDDQPIPEQADRDDSNQSIQIVIPVEENGPAKDINNLTNSGTSETSSLQRQDSAFALCPLEIPLPESPTGISLHDGDVPGLNSLRRWHLCVEFQDDFSIPTTELLFRVEGALDTDEMVHLECKSNAENGSTKNIQNSGDAEFKHTSDGVNHTRMLAFARFLLHQTQVLGRRVLLHCLDGYTDTSTMTIICLMQYIMRDRCKDGGFALNEADERPILPQAYLQLQKSRSFFVSKTAFDDLKIFERAIINFSHSVNRSIHSASAPESPVPTPTMNDASLLPSIWNCQNQTIADSDWHTAPSFDGSLPSRILPHLYLGSLINAVNGGLLKAMGITHVVSVGEKSGLRGYEPWRDENDQEKNCFHICEVENVMDDGFDSLAEWLDECVAFIEQARLSGGKTLVHCRIGVSRSATIVIAYCLRYPDQVAAMRRWNAGISDKSKWKTGHIEGIPTTERYESKGEADVGSSCYSSRSTLLLHTEVGKVHSPVSEEFNSLEKTEQDEERKGCEEDMATLADIYLFVRARRLSVIIQPNLLLFHELLDYERRIRGRWSMAWAVLAREVGKLNARYRTEPDRP